MMFRKVLIIIITISSFTISLLTGCKEDPTEAIKLGATFPLTGEVASYGEKAKRGIVLKIDEINSTGGLLGKKVEIDFQDDKNDKKEAVTIFNKFATIDKYPVVFGSAGSTLSLSIAPLANRNKVILISPVSSSSKLSTDGGKYFFRTVPSDNLQAEILAGWVTGIGIKQVAVVYTNNSWGKPLAEGFRSLFMKSGGKVLLFEGIQENSADFRTLITKLKGIKNLQAVISPTYPKEGGIFVKQIKELGLHVKLFGGDNWGSPEFIKIAGKAAEGVFYTSPAESKSPEYKEFEAKYEKKFGEKPDILGAYAYDAANAIVQAIKNAQSRDPEKILESLKKVSFKGASGDISFKDNGDVNLQGFEKKTIKNSKSIAIK